MIDKLVRSRAPGARRCPADVRTQLTPEMSSSQGQPPPVRCCNLPRKLVWLRISPDFRGQEGQFIGAQTGNFSDSSALESLHLRKNNKCDKFRCWRLQTPFILALILTITPEERQTEELIKKNLLMCENWKHFYFKRDCCPLFFTAAHLHQPGHASWNILFTARTLTVYCERGFILHHSARIFFFGALFQH